MAAPIKRNPHAAEMDNPSTADDFFRDFFRLALVLVAGAPDEEHNTQRRTSMAEGTVDPLKVVIVTSP
jgi:hypothetical protein